MPSKFLTIESGVQKAIENKQGVVALESTIIAHGMPFPENLECALQVEEEVRSMGAVPATVAIMDGRMKVGLTKKELEDLASLKEVSKVSRRDIPFILAKKQPGATTVSATMIIAAMAGIRVFATGGIGGVHKGVSETWDISADLEDLANTNMVVVCAGAKSILDIPKTLEYLETKGIPVIGYKTKEFPAFYTQSSGCPVDYHFDDVKELAAALHTKWQLPLQGGSVVGVPVPTAYAMERIRIENIISKALHDAKDLGVRGKEVTPFLLQAVKEKTQGESLKTNIELVKNNARVAAQLAKEIAALNNAT